MGKGLPVWETLSHFMGKVQLLVLLPVLEKNSTYFVQTQSLFQYKWLDSYLDKLGTHTPFEATPQADMVAVSDQ